MRQTISGLIAAIAVMTVSAAPAMACGGGLFQGSCSPCGQTYVQPCAQTYVPAYTGCNTGCGGGWGFDHLADPEEQYYGGAPQQYYYANQGPTYTGPGAFAPYPTYREGTVSGWGGYRTHRHYGHYGYRSVGRGYGYGYAARRHAGYGYGYRGRGVRRYY